MQPTESTFSAVPPASSACPSVIYKPANRFELLDWREVFAHDRPVEIDLGCGKGSFLLWAAGTHPQRNFLGVERLLRRLRRVDRKAVRAGLDNIRLIRIEASYLIVKLIPDSSVSTYHILFPDPWPKRRHHSRRLVCAPLLGDVHPRLRPVAWSIARPITKNTSNGSSVSFRRRVNSRGRRRPYCRRKHGRISSVSLWRQARKSFGADGRSERGSLRHH